MRRLLLLTVVGLLLPPARLLADPYALTISTGYNESSLLSPFNRSTALQSRTVRGRGLYTGSLDSHGLVSLGVGLVASGSDIERHANLYPTLTVFARPGEGSGVALVLHQEWHRSGPPTGSPGKYLTLFQTEGGLVWQDGRSPKVRMTQRFVTSERRFPGRSQGVEWVWEFRGDFPPALSTVSDRGQMRQFERRTMRFENWVFFSRELGTGILRVSLGATHETAAREDGPGEPAGQAWERALGGSGSGLARVPVLMGRLSYEIRRW